MKPVSRFVDLVMNTWWLRHLIFWIFVWNYYALGLGMSNTPFTWKNIMDSYIRWLPFLPGFMLVTYPLMYWLVPRVLLHRRNLLFIFLFGALILVVAGAYVNLLNLQVTKQQDYRGFDTRKGGRNILPFIHVSGIAIAVKFIKKAYFEEMITLRATEQKTLAELELLKAQIHPHFLFNTLNSLFAHTLRGSADAPNIVVKLAGLLRFMIYGSRESFIPLADEIQLLQNYVDLEKLRYGQELQCEFTVKGDPSGFQIRPLLLIPILENCFKHGMSQQIDSRWIRVQLTILDQRLEAEMTNTFNSEYHSGKQDSNFGGIGQVNVQRRLELLYPGNYTFEYHAESGLYKTLLQFPLLRYLPGNREQRNDQEKIGQVIRG